MATVNFSVPDETKDAFNRDFSGRNKSAMIARLMRQAVAKAEQQRQREAASRNGQRDGARDRAGM